MKNIFFILMISVSVQLAAQDIVRYKRVIKDLSSARYQGRGYAHNGANKAGKYLEKAFRKAGCDEVICQPFRLDINTFPGKMKMSVDGQQLTAGTDFSMREFAPGIKGKFPVYYIDTLHYDSEQIFRDLTLPEYHNAFVVWDFWYSYKKRDDFKRMQNKDSPNAGLILLWEEPLKFYKAYGEKVIDKPIVWAPYRFPRNAKSVSVDIENRFFKDYECFNVIAKVEGMRHDSCYVFTAHYDHLGNLGSKVYYAGANDNASGTAAIVTLAEYYARHKPTYDMYFIAFSGEDANLRGSEWYAQHPVVPLSQIKYLFNIDMIGDNNPVLYCETSDEGMLGYTLFEALNTKKRYFKDLHRGRLAANSDHWSFAKRNVPCIFLENKEGDAFKYYHTIHDTYQNALFDTYEPLFRMVRDFIEQY